MSKALQSSGFVGLSRCSTSTFEHLSSVTVVKLDIVQRRTIHGNAINVWDCNYPPENDILLVSPSILDAI